MTDFFRITGTDPYSGYQYLGRYSPVSIAFNDWVDTSTVRNAISFSPTVSVNIGYYFSGSGATVSFYPNPAFPANTTYTVNVKSSLRSASGDTLSSPYSFGFTTAQY